MAIKKPACPVCKLKKHVEYEEIYEPFTMYTVIGSGAIVIDSYYKCKKCGIRFDPPQEDL